jgi:protein required for attachment to host cells
MATWILVAHRAGARVFEHNNSQPGLQLVSTLQNEAGRLKSGALESDKPGSSFSTGAVHGGHPMGHEDLAHERVAEGFAKELCELLAKGRSDKRYDSLVLVAEPHFVGILRAKLDHQTAQLVTATVSKDLGHVPAHELSGHLRGIAM